MADTSLLSPPSTEPAPVARPRLRTGGCEWKSAWAPAVVLLAASALATGLYAKWLGEWRHLWTDPIHDRNAHLFLGVTMAADLRHGRLLQLLSDVDKARTWPPLHDGALVGAALLLGRGDVRWAVLPSLAGWVGAAWLAYLLARRTLDRDGWVAGLLAALFVLVSPAQRAFATDVMLESLGACLTLAVLYSYVRLVQTGTRGAARWLALSLTTLFLHKYNYWLLAVFALLVTEFGARPRDYLHRALLLGAGFDWRAWMVRQARQPFTYLLGALVAAVVAIQMTGGATFEIAGRQISLHSSVNLVSLCYFVLLLRLVPWYLRAGRLWVARGGAAVGALVHWHVFPVLVWFLWPQKLAYFVWFANPAANVGEHPSHDWWGGYTAYWNWAVSDYHYGAWCALAAAALLIVAALALLAGKLRPGAGVVLAMVMIAGVLTVHHPNRKARFLHSWLPVAWVGAGIGAACLAGTRLRLGGRPLRPALAALVGGLAIAQVPGLWQPAHAEEGGTRSASPSMLDLTEWYLPYLSQCRHVAIFSNVPMKFLAQWTYRARYERLDRPETDIKGFDTAGPLDQASVRNWFNSGNCEAIVYVDVLPRSPFFQCVPGAESLARYAEELARQKAFAPAHRRVFAAQACTVTVWTRARERGR